mgnify:FL=1|tara:strand:+ start:477 stop:779 length:303 start_codon:yes stop_codon:yes gene_type:complete
MARLGNIVRKIRSKNAGPFWLTIDIFCVDSGNFQKVQKALSTSVVAALFNEEEANIHQFNIEQLNVIKFSLPRPHIQGTAGDTDMHGASYAVLLEEWDMA